MLRLFFLCLFLVASTVVFVSSLWAAPMVYEDEYVFWELPDAQITKSKIRRNRRRQLMRKYNVVKGGWEKIKLACPRKIGLQESAEPRRPRKVEYKVDQDKCRSNPVHGYLCSPNFVVSIELEPNDGFYRSGQMWGMNGKYGSEANKAWDIIRGTTSKAVAVIDTGVNLNHGGS